MVHDIVQEKNLRRLDQDIQDCDIAMLQDPSDAAAGCFCKDSHCFCQKIIFPDRKNRPGKPQEQISEQHLGLCETVLLQKFPLFFPEVSSEWS